MRNTVEQARPRRHRPFVLWSAAKIATSQFARSSSTQQVVDKTKAPVVPIWAVNAVLFHCLLERRGCMPVRQTRTKRWQLASVLPDAYPYNCTSEQQHQVCLCELPCGLLQKTKQHQKGGCTTFHFRSLSLVALFLCHVSRQSFGFPLACAGLFFFVILPHSLFCFASAPFVLNNTVLPFPVRCDTSPCTRFYMALLGTRCVV